MDSCLLSLASEALTRLEGRGCGARRQLLACLEGHGLLKSPQGLEDVVLKGLDEVWDLTPLIDHTLLKADATSADVDRLCDEAMTYGFASVCVNPLWVSRAAARLAGSSVRTCTVVGFPLGASTSRMKAEEARELVAFGAAEIDMVFALGCIKGGNWEEVRKDLSRLREAIPGVVLKGILETCLLTEPEKIRACEVAVEVGLDFVKTSTGFAGGGATESDVALMRAVVGDRCGVKASGGIRSYSDALRMVLAGATRLGLSSSLVVAEGGTRSGQGY